MGERSIEILTDALGRKLTVQDLNVLQQARLLRAAGPAQSGNQAYFGMVECAAMVTEIDGVPCPFPASEIMIDAAIAKLDDEGMAAVMIARTQKITAVMETAQAAIAAGGVPESPLERSAS